MLKMAASLLLILGGAGIGYARSREITEREKNLEILLQILFFLKGEIRCGNSSLPDAFREIAAKISGFFGTILRDAAQEMEDTGGKNLDKSIDALLKSAAFFNEVHPANVLTIVLIESGIFPTYTRCCNPSNA